MGFLNLDSFPIQILVGFTIILVGYFVYRAIRGSSGDDSGESSE